MDCVALAGLFRDARDATNRAEANAGGGSSAGPESAARADDDGSCGILGAPVSRGTPRIDATLSEAFMAGAAVEFYSSSLKTRSISSHFSPGLAPGKDC